MLVPRAPRVDWLEARSWTPAAAAAGGCGIDDLDADLDAVLAGKVLAFIIAEVSRHHEALAGRG